MRVSGYHLVLKDDVCSMDRLGTERGGSWQRYDEFEAHVASRKFSETDAVPTVTILVVEDEWLLRQALCDELQAAGWSVLEAASGERALAILQSHAVVDLLITDIRLEGAMTGWELARRSRDIDAGLPVIYVSGNKPDEARRVRGGVFLDKPYAIEKLIAACRKLGLH